MSDDGGCLNPTQNVLRRNWRSIFIVIALFVDSLSISSSFGLAFLARLLFPNAIDFDPHSLKWVVLYLWFVPIACAMFLGLYRSAFHSNLKYQHLVAWKSYLTTIAIVFTTFYLFQAVSLRRITFLYFLTLPVVFALGRYFLNSFNRMMQRRGFGVHKVMILGSENGGMEVFRRFKGFPELGYDIKGFVSTKKGEKREFDRESGRLLPHYSLSELKKVAIGGPIDRIFIPSTRHLEDGYEELIELCKSKKMKLKVVSPEFEELLRFSKVHDIAGITLFSPPRLRIEKGKRILKRSFDLLAASAIVLFLLPVFGIIALAILLEDGRSILFSQKRALVKGGKEIKFLKFRSMIKDAEKKQDDMYKVNETSGGLFMLKVDPRITKVGRILRRYSLDELPQLFNVLRGEMSLVGPRPLSIADLNNICEENKLGGFYKLRAKAKPGMTGLWQISGRREVSFKEMVLLDLYYIENQSPLFDLEILLATVPVVLLGKGGY